MANNFSVTGTIKVKPFIVNIFDDGIYIIFTDTSVHRTEFVNMIQFPKRIRKLVIKFLEEYRRDFPDLITLHRFKGGKILNPQKS